jgi:hypothetical protein
MKSKTQPLRTAVGFCIYNRPDLTQHSFDAIAKARPPKLFVFADGPKDPEDAGLCEATRRVIDRIDWNCELHTNFSETNLGCGRREASGFEWVFENVEEAILVEDDCIPTGSFFWFCQSILEKYRDDDRIMHINGSNFQKGRVRTPYSYYFSKYWHSWGWASWRRAFQHYDYSMSSWPEFRDQGLLAMSCPNPVEQRHWTNIFDRMTSDNPIDTWDYQWLYAIFRRRGMSVTPSVNMVSNVGCGRPDATHHKVDQKPAPTEDIWEIHHPPRVVVDSEADSFTFRHHYFPLRRRIRYALMKVLGRDP